MPKPTFEQLTSVRRLVSPAWSPDGDWFAYLADTSGRLQLWLQPKGGGFPTQLTALRDRRVVAFAWSRDGGRIAFTADLKGNETPEVFVMDVVAGRPSWPRQLTDRPEVEYNLSGWSADGRIVLSANDRLPAEMDPLLLDPVTGEVERLMTGGLYYAGEVSPSGRWLAVTELRSNTDSDVHLVDLESGEARRLTEHAEEAKVFAGPWATDESGFYLSTDAGREFSGLAFWSFEKDGWEYVHQPERDVDAVSVSRGGRYVAYVDNDGGNSVISILDQQEQRLLRPELPVGVVVSSELHPSEPRVLLMLATPRESGNIFEFDFATGKLRRLEQSMLGGVAIEDLAVPELVSYPSFDREIPAWLYQPEGPGPHPVVLSIHGGPEAQERPDYGYGGMYQYLVSRGVAVLAPNIRGSTGYGKSYQKLIQRDWGGGELRDIEAAADWLAQQTWADASRLGIWGGSFGGFATLSAIARLPDRWAAAAAAVGPSNLVTFARSVPPHWRSMMRNFVGDPEDDHALLLERSPITYVENVRTPLLVYQGAHDPRVVKAESDQMVEALRGRGVEVEYIVDEESGHGPASAETAIEWWRAISAFLIEKLT
jgi:dipeptidyl aminopeptidase/acylaminoacyl peptidase